MKKLLALAALFAVVALTSCKSDDDDPVITISKNDNSRFAITFDTTDIAVLNGGDSKTISYTIEGATENTVVRADAGDGWKAKVDMTSTDRGTITVTAPDPIVEGEILVIANDGSDRTAMVSLNCVPGQISMADDNSVEVTSAGGTREIKVSTNLDYTVEIPDNAKSWLSLVSETRAMREDTIVFELAANEGVLRSATVALIDEQGKTLQTIIFRQQGTCSYEVHVETKGELENVLSDYDYANIESLKITGVLNDVDFLFIYSEMPNLKSLDISEVNITTLPTNAFYQSKNIENLILPNTLITIGEYMFSSSQLKSILIPASVETIEAVAFKGCSELRTVTFEKGSHLKTIGGGYSGDYYGAFLDCKALFSIEIPASVETIGETAFRGCSNLTTVTFEKGSHLKTIRGGSGYSSKNYYGVFSYCTALSSIEIPASVETIEETAFQGCSNLTTVTFEKGSHLKTIGGGCDSFQYHYYGAFADCTALSSIEIPASVETIKKGAFKGCSELRTVTFEKGSRLKTIGGGASEDYSEGYGAFSDCTALSSIEIPASVETIQMTAFQGCSNLMTVTFEKGSHLKTIDGGYGYRRNVAYPLGVFTGCSSLTSIEIPASVEIIEASAFEECSNLRTVTFEKGSRLKTIDGKKTVCNNDTYIFGAFTNCSSLTSIEIPASVERIGTGAFFGCSSLTTVDMSECIQVQSIGTYAFYKDSELRLFKIGTVVPPECSSSAFSGIGAYSVLKVPSGCTDAYKKVSGWEEFASITGLDE